MRRALISLAAAAFTVLALAGPAGAASGQVTHFNFSGKFAEADWSSSSATRTTETLFQVVSNRGGSPSLFVERFSSTSDANGNLTGFIDTTADTNNGVSFALPQSLASASLSAFGVPAQTCTFDANFNQIGCEATTINVTAAWTGQGPISRGVSTSHVKTDGFSVTTHDNGTFRDASATGTFNGTTFSASQLNFADFGTDKSGSVTVCVGGSC